MSLLRRNPQSLAERAEKAGDWTGADTRYEELSETLRAIGCYEKAGALDHCGELALTLEREDREEIAASFFMKAGMPHRAATLYRNAGRDGDAGKAFL